MKHLLFFLAVLFAIFLNTGIAPSLGFEMITTIAFLPMILYIVVTILFQKYFFKKLRNERIAVSILVLAVIIMIFKWTLEQDYFKRMIEMLIIPMLMSICFENLNKKKLNILFLLVVVFFIVESSLAIVEWLLDRNFFLVYESNDAWKAKGFFRSTSLLGRHPLANAQVVAVFMAFIAISNFKIKFFQIILFFLGYVSLFCFNARGATLVATVFLVPYFILKINQVANKRVKWIINIGVIVMIIGMFYLVTQTPLGGRLMNSELIDSSTGTRLEVFQFHQFYKTTDELLWGHPDLFDYINMKLPVENGVIALILDYGIIFAILMLFLLISFQYQKLSVYPKHEKWLLLAVFFIIGSMNPNLASPIQWTLWIFAYYAFRPGLLNLQTEKVSIPSLSVNEQPRTEIPKQEEKGRRITKKKKQTIQYNMDLKKIDIHQYKDFLMNQYLISKKQVLHEKIDENFKIFEDCGFKNLSDLKQALSTKTKITKLSYEKNITPEYLNLLKGEIVAFDKKGIAFKDFHIIDNDTISQLKKNSIKNTKDFYEYYYNENNEESITDELNISVEKIRCLISLSNLVRINGINSLLAVAFYEAGYKTINDIVVSKKEEMLEKITKINKEKKFKKVKFGLQEMQFVIDCANLMIYNETHNT